MTMKIEEKSIAYAFISNGVHIYSNEKGHFIIAKLICLECGESWYMNLTECFLCGTINPYLYRCSSCHNFQSITKSSNKCNYCESSELFMVCPNEDCISNTDKQILSEINGKGGVFNKDSGFSTAQQYCLTCGSKYHRYKTYDIYIRSLKQEEFNFSDLSINPKELTENAYLIVRLKKKNSPLRYGLIRLIDFIDKKIHITTLYENFQSIVNHLYPVSTS